MTAHHDIPGLVTASAVTGVTAVTSPWWLPSVHHVSTVAADWLPIFGIPLVLMQLTWWAMKLGRLLWRKPNGSSSSP